MLICQTILQDTRLIEHLIILHNQKIISSNYHIFIVIICRGPKTVQSSRQRYIESPKKCQQMIEAIEVSNEKKFVPFNNLLVLQDDCFYVEILPHILLL